MAGALALLLPSVAEAGELGKVRKTVRSSGSSSSRSPSSSRPRPSSSSSRGPTHTSSRPSSSPSRTSSSRHTHTHTHTTIVYARPLTPPPRRTVPTGHSTLQAPVPITVPRYNRFPYEKDRDGLIMRVPQADKDHVGRLWSTQANAEVGYLGNEVWKTGFGLDFDYWRIGIGSDLDWLVEGRLRDAMYLGSTNARFTLIMRPRVRLRIGGGAQYMVDGRTPGQGRREYASGPNATIEAEAFPFRPFTISGRLDYGTLYRAPSILAQATAGVVFRGVQIYGGYEFRRIGDVTLQGPMAGLRVWF